MPVVLEKGGAIPGIIMLIIAGCGAWSLWGAALSRTCDALKRPRSLPSRSHYCRVAYPRCMMPLSFS